MPVHEEHAAANLRTGREKLGHERQHVPTPEQDGSGHGELPLRFAILARSGTLRFPELIDQRPDRVNVGLPRGRQLDASLPANEQR